MLNIFQALFGKQEAVNTASPTLAIDLPFEMIAVPGEEAVAVREQLLAKGGVTPVILGGDRDIQKTVEAFSRSPKAPDDLISDAARLDAAAWLELRKQEDPGRYSAPSAAWPETAPPVPGLSVHLDTATGAPKKTVILALFPTTAAWQVPAHLCYGGWKACPPPAVHVALNHKWHQDFGSVIACMSGDVIECTVARPPGTRDAALALALEQFLYCPDRVHEDAGSLEGLGAALLGAGTWHFRWH
jgi:hypothetical protein